jgi:hypothetical protein
MDMRFRTVDPNRPPEEELIAQFGEARLVKRLDGKPELKGGSEKDRTEAQKWIDMFLSNAAARTGRPTL